jgi:PhoPQ-activated pathogenicity-related protein
MDALQAFSKEELKQPLETFVVTGASKRGWTAWLTGAVEPRAKAIAPMVFDTLNMTKQMPHQVASYGEFSEMIKDYTARKLVPVPDTDQARKLWRMIDPWAYRDKITMPKMILNGTNDPYWTQDATNLYWDDLKGPKYLLYVPNAGHNLQQQIGMKKDTSRILNTLAAFARHQYLDKPMPKLSWKHEQIDGHYQLTATSKPAPKAARLWVADASTKDFRKALWQEKKAVLKNGVASGEVAAPEGGCRVFFIECEYEMDGLTYYLSTQLRIIGKPQNKAIGRAGGTANRLAQSFLPDFHVFLCLPRGFCPWKIFD